MAFGFPAYHEERVRFRCSDSELLDAAEEALEDLGWSPHPVGKWRLRASTGISLWSWGERITVEVERDGRLFVRSACIFPTQCIDWGRNRKNIERLLREVDRVFEDARPSRPSRDEDEGY